MKIKVFFIVVIAGLIFAQKTKLTNIVVYTSGAELTHKTELDLIKGKNSILLSELAFGIDEKSIQVKIDGKASLLTVNKKLNYLLISEKSPEIKKLEIELKTLVNNQKELDDKLSVLAYEEKIIQANLDVGGDKGTAVADVKNMVDYVSKKMTQILSSKMKYNSQKDKNKIEIEKIQNQLRDVRNKYNRPLEEIALEIYSAQKQKVKLEVSYLIYNAGWIPSYDIRAEKLNAPLELTLKAGIYQDSGLDWKNLDMTLSTSRPQFQSKPELNPWYIDFVQELYPSVRVQRGMQKKSMEIQAAAPEAESLAMDEVELDFEVVENLLSIEYKPSLEIDIPSDRKKHFVEVKEYTLDAEYNYFAAPKVNKDVFLIAKSGDFKKNSLLPGQANVFFENKYVGNTYLNNTDSEDFYSIALGRDKNIIVERNQLKDFTEDKFLSSDIERYFGYELIVRNNRKDEVTIKIEDNIPISRQEDIKVELTESGGAEYETKNGKLIWNIEMKPNQKIEKQYKYSVRHPKDKKVTNL